MIILPAPYRPDLDCMAGALAYAALLNHQGQNAKVWLTGTPDAEAQFYLDMFPGFTYATNQEAADAASFTLVDFSEKFAMPDGFDCQRVLEIIDHRFPLDVAENFPNAKAQLDKVGAAATLVVERLMEAAYRPSSEIATMLYGAIYSNTLCLEGALATERDHKAAEWLQSISPGCDQYISQQLAARSAEILSDPVGALIAETKTGPSRFGTYSFSQFEIAGGEAFWQANASQLIAQMQAMAGPVVLNLIDLDGPSSLVYCSDTRYAESLPPQLRPVNDVFCCEPALMRKEIAPFFR